jgi:hypothetical protein
MRNGWVNIRLAHQAAHRYTLRFPKGTTSTDMGFQRDKEFIAAQAPEGRPAAQSKNNPCHYQVTNRAVMAAL